VIQSLLTLQERERQLMAYEIHDGLAQHIATAVLHLQAFEASGFVADENSIKNFQTGMQMLRMAGEEARRLMAGLRPATLDNIGVVAAIDELIWQHRRTEGPKIEFVHKIREERWHPLLETVVFRIVQESLNNALRHSKSPKIRIELVQHGARVRVSVRDWGVGFDTHQEFPGHFGLRGILERARLFNGQVSINSAAAKGTLVVVELPLVDRQAQSIADPASEETVRIHKKDINPE